MQEMHFLLSCDKCIKQRGPIDPYVIYLFFHVLFKTQWNKNEINGIKLNLQILEYVIKLLLKETI